mmetsp:Transcript_10290/g.12055  ORF Transcript_10290/g.12055 Transcript_10290/m.12055 type:complete len:381 (-) Transcript_10290:807-1949(-)|eukprot:CAMPEP_0197854488 /NCGR_PEP_ID=MMETSP1438-20131217/24780_1 /TAXON_ID=1461541 /ORGANISM="Pterosperma sp., Strain CCMP1384" /LENGTH=380 /DNA_ID=CAMNT_0043469249 /DNA_START=152 /DNA_END=1294 /DNA_ORIENTATION=+
MSEEDFEYGNDDLTDEDSPGARGGGDKKVITNQPHDEEVALSEEDEDGESQISHEVSPVGLQKRVGGDSPPPNVSDDERDSEDDEGVESPASQGVDPEMKAAIPKQEPVRLDVLEQRDSLGQGAKKEGSDDSSDDDDDKASVEPGSGGGYNPEDYAHLKVSEEVNELFQYIGRYKPHSHQLDTKLKPFIPDYIPAVGDIDEFIKVARPDGKPDDLGLKVLDEPAAKQSDPTVLNLQLRAVSKQSNLKPMEVTSIEGAERDPKKIANWIYSIQDLHKNKPRPNVAYSKSMPDIETLMQEWPPEVEEMLNSIKLPDESLDLSLPDLSRTLCNILDIPTYNNVVESLHVMFTLYLEFKNNPFLAGKQDTGPKPNVFTIEEGEG